MKQRGLNSIRRLAEKAGLGAPTVAGLIFGDRESSDETVAAVAVALDLPLADVYNMAGIRAPKAAGPWVPTPESARLTERQRATMDELIKSIVEGNEELRPGELRASYRSRTEWDDSMVDKITEAVVTNLTRLPIRGEVVEPKWEPTMADIAKKYGITREDLHALRFQETHNENSQEAAENLGENLESLDTNGGRRPLLRVARSRNKQEHGEQHNANESDLPPDSQR